MNGLKISILDFSQTSLLAFIRNNMPFKRLKDNSSPDEIEYMRKLATFMNSFMCIRDVEMVDYINSNISIDYLSSEQEEDYIIEINRFIRHFVKSNN